MPGDDDRTQAVFDRCHRSGTAGLLCVGLLMTILNIAPPAKAGDMGEDKFPVLYPGAVEAGVSGALTNVEGIQTGLVQVRTGIFQELVGGLIGFEIGLGYTHVNSLDRFDLEGVFSWGKRWGQTGNYPFVSLGGGWRHENVGSFGQSRFPLGIGIGLRSLVGQRAGFRVEYRYRRILNDPVQDYSEHQLTLGVSVFFRNSNKKKGGAGDA